MLARIKFDISPLVTDMLDQLPADVWTSTKTTFEDPALAGGQFVAEIEKRLSAVGHSEKNISKRVFGSEKSPHRVQYAISKNKLVGNYTATDFLTTPTDMNRVAQIAVGNPPYNDGSKGRNPIYQLFLEKYATNPPDYLFKIIPSNWFSQPKNKLGRSVRSSLIKLGVYKIKMNSYSAFENAKVKTCTVFCRKGYTGAIQLVDELGNSTTINDLSRTILYTANKQEIELLEQLKPADPFTTHSGSKGKTNSWRIVTSYRKENFEITPMNQLKILPPNYENQGGYRVFGEFKTKTEAEAALIEYKSFWHSKLVEWVMKKTRTSTTLDNPQIEWVPVPSKMTKFTNRALYKHFKLTPAQIAMVEQ